MLLLFLGHLSLGLLLLIDRLMEIWKSHLHLGRYMLLAQDNYFRVKGAVSQMVERDLVRLLIIGCYHSQRNLQSKFLGLFEC